MVKNGEIAKKGSVYLSDAKISKTNFKPLAILTSFLAIFLIIIGNFTSIPFSKTKITSANAAFMGVLCNNKTLGLNMKATPNFHRLSVVPFMDARNRTWTLEEAYGGNLGFVNYYGETAGDGAGFLLADTDDIDDRVKGDGLATGTKDAIDKNVDKLKAERNISSCTVDNLPLFLASLTFSIASLIMNVITIFVTFAFDSGFVCKSGQTGACVDLVGIIGGKNPNSSSGGIIGALTANIYIPLAVIAIVIAAFSIVYQGIVKRQFRTAFGYLAWILLAFIFGLLALLNPNLLAKAPMTISNSLAGCVIGAFNGENCFSSKPTSAKIDFNTGSKSNSSLNACTSNATTRNPSDKLSMTINGMACSIWKAFILQQHASAEFGVPFDDLDINSEKVAPMIESAGIEPSTFCVGRYTSNSFNNEQKKNILAFENKNNSDVCNLAAYQMYLQTNAITNSDTRKMVTAKPDVRWYNLIAVISQDDEMWNTWNTDISSGFYRVIIGFISIISVIFGGVVLTVLSIYAMVYYISAIILMALAPLFLLFALQPTKGKKLFLGWVQKVVSNLLKYFVSAFFLLISLAFYSAVFGNISNPFVTLIFVIILSIALFMYRKELTELVGKVNMGGEELSNRFSGMADKGKRIGKVAAGAAIGNAHANRSLGVKGALAAGVSGAGQGVNRELSHGSGIIANAARQGTRMKAQNTADFRKEQQDAILKDKNLREESETAQDNIRKDVQESERLEGKLGVSADNIKGLEDGIKADVEQKVALEMSAKFPDGTPENDFAKYAGVMATVNSLDRQRNMAKENGDFVEINRLNNEINNRLEEAEELKNNIPREDFNRLDDEFKDKVNYETKLEMSNNNELNSEIANYNTLTENYGETQARIISNERNRIAADANVVENSAVREQLDKLGDKVKYGSNINASQVKKAKNKAAEKNAQTTEERIGTATVESKVLADAIGNKDKYTAKESVPKPKERKEHTEQPDTRQQQQQQQQQQQEKPSVDNTGGKKPKKVNNTGNKEERKSSSNTGNEKPSDKNRSGRKPKATKNSQNSQNSGNSQNENNGGNRNNSENLPNPKNTRQRPSDLKPRGTAPNPYEPNSPLTFSDDEDDDVSGHIVLPPFNDNDDEE